MICQEKYPGVVLTPAIYKIPEGTFISRRQADERYTCVIFYILISGKGIFSHHRSDTAPAQELNVESKEGVLLCGNARPSYSAQILEKSFVLSLHYEE